MAPSDKIRMLKGRYAVNLASGKSGGMATVYSASDPLANTRVAVKLFRSPVDAEEQELLAEAFRREVAALTALEHPHIVKLLDSGIQEDNGEMFLILEWMDNTLQGWLKTYKPANWDSFYETVARPLLEALNFAHERYCVHRDVKPSNVLVSSSGQVKLADFGISKIKQWMTPSITLAEFQSQPYAPPEPDDGVFSYSRDVFSLAATLVECFTQSQPKCHEDFRNLLHIGDRFDNEVGTVLEHALSLDPAARPRSAGAFLAELERIHRKRLKIKDEVICLRIPPTKIAGVLADVGEATIERARDLINRDIGEQAHVIAFESAKPATTDQSSVGHYRLLGKTYHYHVAVDNVQQNHLVLFGAYLAPAERMEAMRKYAWLPPFSFALGLPTSPSLGAINIQNLQLGFDEHGRKAREEAKIREEELIFNTWNSVLQATLDAEQSRIASLRYTSISVEDRRVTFHLQDPIGNGEGFVGQIRSAGCADEKRLFGEVEWAAGSDVTLYFEHGELETIKTTGSLAFDIRGVEEAVKRQKDALDRARFGRAVRADLGNLLLRPGNSRHPGEVSQLEFVQQDLDEAKKEALRKACGAEDFVIVQGPPGTGKTTFIAELIFQQFKAVPGSRVLIASQTHVALDNAIERIQKFKHGLRIVRIGDQFDARVSPGVRDLLIDKQMNTWVSEVRERGESHLLKWAESHGIKAHDFRVGLLLQRIVAEKSRLADLSRQLDTNRADRSSEGASSSVVSSADEIALAAEVGDVGETQEQRISVLQEEQAAAQQRLRNCLSQIRAMGEIESQLGDLEEQQQREWMASLATESPEAQQFRAYLTMHEEWSARLNKHQDFYDAFLGSCDVVAATCLGLAGRYRAGDLAYDLCIVDEASKATATEMLVPLVRGKRWVVVGDSKQLPPFELLLSERRDLLDKYELDERILEQTLFDRLAGGVPADCCRTLSVQHRMVPAIGNLISHCFYGGTLTSARTDVPDLLAVDCPTPVLWCSTSKYPGREEEGENGNYANPGEARFIAALLKQINNRALAKGKQCSVAVISGYAAQCRILQRQVEGLASALPSITVEVNTVDAFQGREKDVCIYSVTRSNPERKIGFLRTESRINVALSRGRDWLFIVGDHAFCRSAGDPNPLRMVLEYIEKHPTECTLFGATK